MTDKIEVDASLLRRKTYSLAKFLDRLRENKPIVTKWECDRERYEEARRKTLEQFAEIERQTSYNIESQTYTVPLEFWNALTGGLYDYVEKEGIKIPKYRTGESDD